jgi:hypothetical protein
MEMYFMMQSSLPLVALDAFVPPLAPLAALAFLAGGFVLVVGTVSAGIAFAARRVRLALWLGGAVIAVAVAYTTLLVGASLTSRDRTLTAGERKYFCEIDCHVAYEVTSSERAGEGGRAVTLRTWFDPGTIAPFRGDAPLSPGPKSVYLVDDAGRRYDPSPEATASWWKANGGSTPPGRELRPGESYTTTFVFDMPANARAARLYVGDPPGGVERALIGHENSPLHGKIYFALPAPRPEAG